MKKYIVYLLLVSFSNAIAQITTIYTIGDSTMANKMNPETNPERGWCQVLQTYFSNKVVVDNRAVNGRSTRSFINEKRWDSIHKMLKKGDYVFIQFGHNDAKVTDSVRYTNPHTAYRYNIIRFVTEAREKGAIPVLFSSIVRRKFNEQGVFLGNHGVYNLEIRLIAQEYKVHFIDLEYFTELLEISYGFEGSKKLHLHFKKGEHPYYPDGKEDNTHLSLYGAHQVAKIAIQELKKINFKLAKEMKN
jgi:lysophospholipase L1-like esterase